MSVVAGAVLACAFVPAPAAFAQGDVPASITPWEDLAGLMAGPWPDLQYRYGAFHDYVFGGKPDASVEVVGRPLVP
jgi:hypothetical protein